jgi:hypothetical protein
MLIERIDAFASTPKRATGLTPIGHVCREPSLRADVAEA